MDRYLLHLVPRENDDPPVELNVTLTVGGTIVSGDLISEETYFDLTVSKFDAIAVGGLGGVEAVVDEEVSRRREEEGEDFDEEEAAELREAAIEAGLATASDMMVRSYERSADAGRFVHLRNVVIRTTTLGDGFSTDLWRGKLDAVDGFSIGSSSPDNGG